MKSASMILCLLASWACCLTAQAAEALVSIEVRDRPVENGKMLNATFREIQRGADYSIAEFLVTSGGSVSSSLFPIRGACAILAARSEAFMRVDKDSAQGANLLRVSFPKSRESQFDEKKGSMTLSREECAQF